MICVVCYLYLSKVLLQETEHVPCCTVTVPWISMEREALQACFVGKCLQNGSAELCQVVVIQLQHLHLRKEN